MRFISRILPSMFLRNNLYYLFFLAFCIILFAGCGMVSQETAEQKAISFIKGRVKFFTVENNTNIGVDQYDFSVDDTDDMGNEYLITVKVSSLFDNQTRSKEITVGVSKSNGKVLHLNGQRVS